MNHTMVSSLALVFEVVAVAIRAYALTNFLLQMVLGAKGMWPCGGGRSCFIFITYIDVVTQNIQLVSSLL